MKEIYLKLKDINDSFQEFFIGHIAPTPNAK